MKIFNYWEAPFKQYQDKFNVVFTVIDCRASLKILHERNEFKSDYNKKGFVLYNEASKVKAAQNKAFWTEELSCQTCNSA